MPIQQPVQQRLKQITEHDLNQFNGRFVPKLVKSDSESELGSNSSISGRQNLGLIVIVYTSLTLVYIQLMLLAVFLQASATPPGLVFLVSSLAYIGFIVYKVSAFFSSFPTIYGLRFYKSFQNIDIDDKRLKKKVKACVKAPK